MMWNYGYGPMMGWGLGLGIVGVVVNVFFWLVIAWVIVAFVRSFRHFDHHDGDRSLEILKERYAKGEITKKEFEEMKKDLG